MLKIIRNANQKPKPQSYLLQTVPSKEITLAELAEYKKDNCIELEFTEELAHVIRRVY